MEDEITGAITVVNQGNVIWDPSKNLSKTQKTVHSDKRENFSNKNKTLLQKATILLKTKFGLK
ncbi:MAG: hypothetical protein CM1200mP30_27660 [Pseudomonadota bacterium]|nr:MAG: hypothetical protein CM1200mP30_27660 [Pseudomonadota bacterium]